MLAFLLSFLHIVNYFLSINFNKLLGLLKYISCVVGVFYCCAVVETVKGVALRLGLPRISVQSAIWWTTMYTTMYTHSQTRVPFFQLWSRKQWSWLSCSVTTTEKEGCGFSGLPTWRGPDSDQSTHLAELWHSFNQMLCWPQSSKPIKLQARLI